MKMKHLFKFFTVSCFALLATNTAKAQCAAGEIEIELIIETDQYAYEGFWSLVEGTSNCGINEIANGGNAQVGCTGGGQQSVTNGGYGNHLTFSAGTWCVNLDSTYTLHYVDDWGDGGFGFTVLANGYEALAEDGTGSNQTWTFVAQEPPANDVELNQIINPFAYNASGPSSVKALIKNKGKDTIQTLDVHYAFNGGNVESATLNNLTIGYNESYTFLHPTSFNLNNGSYSIKVWTGDINGVKDSINTNDTLNFDFMVGPGTPNYVDGYLNANPTAVEIGNASNGLNKPTDLDFHPILTNSELWVINKRNENTGGSTTTFWNAGKSNQTSLTRVDGNAWHFMSMPTGISFGENLNFGTSPGVMDANHNGGDPFTGPSLWSSDSNIYALPSGGNGSHLDMLHSSPKCQGITHEKDNAYWVFDGHNSDIVRYDFQDDHGPGADYHGDAIVHRYRDHSVKMDPNEKVSSHLVLDKTTGWLYVVDYGNKRVMRLDINSGTLGANSNINNYEPVAEYKEVNGYTWETVADTGLQEPSGIEVIGNRMLVSDYATGEIFIYDISSMPATRLGTISTSAAGIMGIKIGPEGRIWYADYDGNKVVQLNIATLSINDAKAIDFSVYPNPSSNGNFNIRFSANQNVEVSVLNMFGQTVHSQNSEGANMEINTNLKAGSYIVQIKNAKTGTISIEKLVVL